MNFVILDTLPPDGPKLEQVCFTGEFRFPKNGEWYWDETAREPRKAYRDFDRGGTDVIPSFGWRRHIMEKRGK